MSNVACRKIIPDIYDRDRGNLQSKSVAKIRMLKKTLALLLCVALCWIAVGCFQSADLEDLGNFEEEEVKSYYKTLGLQPGASQKEVKKAYHRLSRQYHPDKNGGDPEKDEKFLEIKEAYEALEKLKEAGRLPATP
jgi:preprotein translocase subunit Sec63